MNRALKLPVLLFYPLAALRAHLKEPRLKHLHYRGNDINEAVILAYLAYSFPDGATLALVFIAHLYSDTQGIDLYICISICMNLLSSLILLDHDVCQREYIALFKR